MITVKESGVNMLDVKRRNRSSILQLIYQLGEVSRKDIALHLGLTPAAITMITGEMIAENLIISSGTGKVENRKGRREMMLKINGIDFASIGVTITRHKFRIVGINLNNDVLFESTVSTQDCNKKSKAIIEKLYNSIKQHLQEEEVLKGKKIVGIGVSITGIVNTLEGISINALQVWDEKNVHLADILSEQLEFPVLLTNNVCALSHVESILFKENQQKQTLFIKYGPGLGAAHSLVDGVSSVFNYKTIELGHVIAEANGTPCVCGNQGCIETIISYDAIENTLRGLLSETHTPKLWQLLDGDPKKINIQDVILSYDAGDETVCKIFNRVIIYLSQIIKDVGTLFDPQSIVLYGELFEHEQFKTMLRKQLEKFTNTEIVTFRHFDPLMEMLGPATTVIYLFFEKGGI